MKVFGGLSPALGCQREHVARAGTNIPHPDPGFRFASPGSVDSLDSMTRELPRGVVWVIHTLVELELVLRWGPGGGDGKCLTGLTDVLQDAFHIGGMGDERDDAHRTSAPGTEEGERVIDPGQQHRPGLPRLFQCNGATTAV